MGAQIAESIYSDVSDDWTRPSRALASRNVPMPYSPKLEL